MFSNPPEEIIYKEKEELIEGIDIEDKGWILDGQTAT